MKIREVTKKRKNRMFFFLIALIVVLGILAAGIWKTAIEKEEEQRQPVRKTEPAEQVLQMELQPEEEKNATQKAIEEQMKELKIIQLHLDGYAKTIFAGWEWILQEELSNYAKEHEIDAENAVVLAYIGYDPVTTDHSFYIQLDDTEGTIVVGKYHPYQAGVEKTNKTVQEIQKEKEEIGDPGMPEGIEGTESQETDLESEEIAVVPYADMEIREVPEALANALGKDASKLPGRLAGFLAAHERGEDTYAVYAKNRKEEDGKLLFDLKLQDGTVVHVQYQEGKYTFTF